MSMTRYNRKSLTHHDRSAKFNPAYTVPRDKSRKRKRRNASRHVDQPPTSAAGYSNG